jgi:hypothetical protein
MATDSIIGDAGRTGVVLILNGSRSKKVREWEWDQLPDYGRLQHLTADQIARKVDWCIHHGWLRIEYDRHIPLLFHTPKSWEQVKALWVTRILGWFAEWTEAQHPEKVWPRLETIHRDIKFMLLDEIAQAQRVALVPILHTWFPHEIRAVRTAINRTLQALGKSGLPHPKHRNRGNK